MDGHAEMTDELMDASESLGDDVSELDSGEELAEVVNEVGETIHLDEHSENHVDKDMG